ncbi:hypothetical protein MASR2M17_01100 [Aminivibrio sp.]
MRIGGNTATDCYNGMDLGEEFDEGTGADAEITGNTVAYDPLLGTAGTGIGLRRRTPPHFGAQIRWPYEYGMYIEDRLLRQRTGHRLRGEQRHFRVGVRPLLR